MNPLVDPEIQKLQTEVSQNQLKFEESLNELGAKVREKIVEIGRDPDFRKKALLLTGAVVVVGFFLFYDRGSKT